MAFDDKTSAEQLFDIREAIPGVLEGIANPMPTRVLAEKLARILDGSADRVGAQLLKLAPVYPRATHNGSTSMRFGRRMTGWLWHSTPQAEGSVNRAAVLTPGPLVTAPPPVIENWDVAPALKEGYVIGRCLVCRKDGLPVFGDMCDPCDAETPQ